MIFVSALTVGSAAHARLQPGDWKPAPPLATTCDCMPAHGTCNADCTITCDAGFADCDGLVSTGCEFTSQDPCMSVVSCTQLTPNPGAACDNDCTTGGQCDNNGVCQPTASSTMQPDNTVCNLSVSDPTCETNTGGCASGVCKCNSGHKDLAGWMPPDFAMTGDDEKGHTPQGCACDLSHTATTPWAALLLVAALVLVLRRRRA